MSKTHGRITKIKMKTIKEKLIQNMNKNCDSVSIILKQHLLLTLELLENIFIL